MRCHECGREISPDNRFCNGCGTSVAAVTEPTEALPTVGDDGDPAVPSGSPLPPPMPAPAASPLDADPVWAVTGPVPVVTDDDDLPPTEPVTEVVTDIVTDVVTEPTDTTPAGGLPSPLAATPSPDVTEQMPVTTPAPDPQPTGEHRSFRFGFVPFLSVVTAVGLVIALYTNLVEITSDSPLGIDDSAPDGFRLGTWVSGDLADNLPIAGIICAVLLVVGAVAAGSRVSWGSGLAGGSGLGAAGLAAVTIGIAHFPIDDAYDFAAIPTEQQFTLTITKSLGYWLVIGAGIVGTVVFFASVNDAFDNRHRGLNPWIAALGALAVVVTTAGPLLPQDPAVFSDNWYVSEGPGDPSAMLVALRLVQLGLFALGGVVGFLTVRRWGLGMVAGVLAPVAWLGASTRFGLGTGPIGPGFANPGASPIDLHGVTVIGLSGTLVLLICAMIAAYDRPTRR